MRVDLVTTIDALIERIEDAEGSEWIAPVQNGINELIPKLHGSTRTLAEDMESVFDFMYPGTGGDTYEDYEGSVISDLQTIREEVTT